MVYYNRNTYEREFTTNDETKQNNYYASVPKKQYNVNIKQHLYTHP